MDDQEGAFPCPTCGQPMTPGEIGLGGRAGILISWRDIVEGEPGAAHTMFSSEGDGALVRPALICRACEGILVDFAVDRSAEPGADRRSFEERVRQINGQLDFDAIEAILREGDPRECTKAIEALVEVGPRALPLLERLSQDEDPDVRVDAQRALDLLG